MLCSHDSSIGIATGYGLDGQGSIPRRGISFTPALGAHRASYGIGTGGRSFPGTKLSGREAEHSLASGEVKNGGATPPFPIRLHDMTLN
jgi:hypothetical protein